MPNVLLAHCLLTGRSQSSGAHQNLLSTSIKALCRKKLLAMLDGPVLCTPRFSITYMSLKR